MSKILMLCAVWSMPFTGSASGQQSVEPEETFEQYSSSPLFSYTLGDGDSDEPTNKEKIHSDWLGDTHELSVQSKCKVDGKSCEQDAECCEGNCVLELKMATWLCM